MYGDVFQPDSFLYIVNLLSVNLLPPNAVGLVQPPLSNEEELQRNQLTKLPFTNKTSFSVESFQDIAHSSVGSLVV